MRDDVYFAALFLSSLGIRRRHWSATPAAGRKENSSEAAHFLANSCRGRASSTRLAASMVPIALGVIAGAWNTLPRHRHRASSFQQMGVCRHERDAAAYRDRDTPIRMAMTPKRYDSVSGWRKRAPERSLSPLIPHGIFSPHAMLWRTAKAKIAWEGQLRWLIENRLEVSSN